MGILQRAWQTTKNEHTLATGAMSLDKVSGLDTDELSALGHLIDTWSQKRIRNNKRLEYYDGKNQIKDLGISIPPTLKNVDTVCGWPAKAVDALAARSHLDGFTFTGDVDNTLDIVLRENNFDSIYNQAIRSTLVQSCAFITLSAGKANEPKVIISAYSALNAAAIWDVRKKRIGYGMTIIEIDKKTKQPTWINLYTPDAILEIVYNGTSWDTNRIYHVHGRPLMEVLTYRPSLERPFGRSRITRAVMSITDSAVREALRAEVSSEFFTAPQRYLLGASEEDFDRDRWHSYTGSIFLASRDGNGDVPAYGQLPQGTMQPHIDYMRSLAASFAGETNIPVSYLGIIHDNPASAEAMSVASEELVIEAQDLNDVNTNALRNIGLLTMAIATNRPLFKLTEVEQTIMPHFMDPARPSIISQSDAMVKQASVAPWLAETTVFVEELGYNKEQIARMQSERRTAEAMITLNQSGVKLGASHDQQT